MSVAGRYVGQVDHDWMDAVSYYSYDPDANLIEEPVIRIHPQRLTAWSIDTGGFERNSRSVG
jgi:hypothetical protein